MQPAGYHSYFMVLRDGLGVSSIRSVIAQCLFGALAPPHCQKKKEI